MKEKVSESLIVWFINVTKTNKQTTCLKTKQKQNKTTIQKYIETSETCIQL